MSLDTQVSKQTLTRTAAPCERGGGDDHLKRGKKKRKEKKKKSQLSSRIKLLSETLTGRGNNAIIFTAWLPFKYLSIIFIFFFFFFWSRKIENAHSEVR